MIVPQLMTDDEDNVLDLSVKKSSSSSSSSSDHHANLSSLPSPPSSSTSSSSIIVSPKPNLSSISSNKRMLETANLIKTHSHSGTIPSNNKRPLRFQCKHCDYKAPSTSLMQNHIYRHTDLTPYACAHCGHKSTTKSTIMVHIELCHPNMEVKIIENRVREQDFYCDLNSSEIASISHVNTSISTTTNSTSSKQEPQTKKVRRSNQYDSESAPINGVAISLKNLEDEENESSRASDELSETENLEPILFDDIDEQINDSSIFDTPPTMAKPSLKLKLLSQPMPTVESFSSTAKEPESDDGSEYLLVYNRPKQYYGSLYEPDKQYACKLCSYTTNHRPSMEDHVFVHTNEKPYKCGYCGEEIYTRYAATYHIKYKHAGMPRNFIQNKADVTQYYVNRAKKDDEKNQFKVIDTRRVKVPTRTGKSNNNQSTKTTEANVERTSIQHAASPPSSNMNTTISPSTSSTATATATATTTTTTTKSSVPSTNIPQNSTAPPDYRFLLAWSYYLASQAAWLSPILQQHQQGQIPPSLSTDPEAAAKFLQAMQSMMEPLTTAQTSTMANDDDHDENDQIDSKKFLISKEEINDS